MATRTARTPPTPATARTPRTPPTAPTPRTPATAATPRTPPTPPTPATPRTRGARAGFVYGERELTLDCEGADVVELQIRLAGFRGTLLDGDFGNGTGRQVVSFQRDAMKMAAPTGVVDRATFEAIDAFAQRHPIDFAQLRCPCGTCGGFGQGRFRGLYLSGHPKVEAYHRYEYPGLHRALLWAVRAVLHYVPERRFLISSGYRCSVHNLQKGRTSTNHHGKAIDLDIVLEPREGKREDMAICDAARARIVETADAQIGWLASNRKALEPANIAPTWVHYDVRCYDAASLADTMFCTTPMALDNPLPIRV